jgi:hypothetical protein
MGHAPVFCNPIQLKRFSKTFRAAYFLQKPL